MAAEDQSIEDVIERLDQIIDQSRADKSPLGYFAALYRKVTIQVRDDICAKRFADNPRMERLDVLFASRYLTAYDAFRAGQSPTHSWAYAFAATQQWWPIVLQHLLLGINAHINLDLGIAAARTAPGDQLADLKGDFNRINTVLAGLVGEVQAELAQIWPMLRLLNKYLGSVDDVLINFSMKKARDAAWRMAEQLAPLDQDEQERKIARRDREVALFARVIRHPGITGSLVTHLVRLGERGTIARRITILE